jgi:hypothetical protein
MTRQSRIATVLAGFALAAAVSTIAAAETIKIGVNQPLTGAVAASGNYVTNGAKIAADEINAQGGLLGQQVELVIEDNKSNPTEAVAVAEKLDLHARRHAQAHGVRRADAGRDLVLGEDHDRGQSVGVSDLADLRDGSQGVRGAGRQVRHRESGFPGREQ